MAPEPTPFAERLTQAQSKLYALTCAMVGPQLAPDVLQEANRVLWENATDYDTDRPFLPWAAAITRNQVRAARKRVSRDRLLPFDDDVAERLADRAVARHQEHDLRQAALADCLEHVPDHNRSLLRRRYQDGEAVQDIAAALGRTANAVAVALHRVRAALADCIQGARA